MRLGDDSTGPGRRTAVKLSPTMQGALDVARQHGGRLERWSGGFWTYPGCASQTKNLPMPTLVPDWYVSTHTIHALIDRGVMRVSKRAHGDGYTIEVEAVDNPAPEVAPGGSRP